jgi:pilus assembly protein CpaB
MINVYMPVQRIPAGTQLSPVMFRVEGMSPVSLAALGGQPVKGEAELVGKYAKGLIMPGRPVMADQLMDAPDNQITRKIRPGYRAITIQVDNVSGIEGWGLPGTKVDVLWQSSAGEGEQIVTTIVKNAQILSVAGKSDSSSQSSGSSLVGGPAGAKGLPIPPNSHGGIGGAALGGGDTNTNFTVTLLVTPDDGQKIFLASRSGDMSLMLRGDFETASDSASQASVTSKRAMQGGEKKGDERVEGVAKARRSDGSIEEWSVIEGRVWRWDQAAGGTTWNR